MKVVAPSFLVLTLNFSSVSGLCGVVKSSTANDYSPGGVRAVSVPGFDGDAHDVPHLAMRMAVVFR